MKTRLATLLISAVCTAALARHAAVEFPPRTIECAPLSLLDDARSRLPVPFSDAQQRTVAPPSEINLDAASLRRLLEQPLKHPRDFPGM
jgi:hypothetical protein